ncbi:MAG: hypothetical protein JW778_01935 [Candidatus Altiarchaeota archaeon]|nr:hypothetical protein [Candidatus Altiarchaeota archaeon]
MADKKAKFMRIYANVPEAIRGKDIIVVIKNKPYTWNTAMIEIKNDSELGKQIIDKLAKMKII